MPLPGLAEMPWLGPVLFNQFALVYLAFLLVPLAAFVLYRTPWGLALRTVGENPHAAVSAGVDVASMRYQALMISGALMGIAGAYLSLAQFNAFTFGVVSGRGWVCIALVVLGQWDPWRVAGAALLFGALDALGLRLQSSGWAEPALSAVPLAAVPGDHRRDGAAGAQRARAGRTADAVPARGALSACRTAAIVTTALPGRRRCRHGAGAPRSWPALASGGGAAARAAVRIRPSLHPRCGQ